MLNREFYVDHFGEKWLTDVIEMKYRIKGKTYMSAILDLADKSIVSFVILEAQIIMPSFLRPFE